MAKRPSFAREAPDKLAELARSVHRLMEQMLATDVGDPELDEDLEHAIRTTEELRARLEPHGRGRELHFGDEEGAGGRPYYVRGALVGPHHPMYLPIEYETSEQVTRGSVHFDVVWEGPPSCVHGGYIAYLYDCIMGHHNQMVGIPGMTGTLEVRYRRPAPLYADLRFEVRTIRRSGRKILDEATLWLGEELISEATGLFIVPKDFVENLRR